MAQRRMMSKKIIDTDLFLSLPPTAQNLYFHFLLRADDDGFVGNPKMIMKMVNAAEDDIKLLIVKRLVIPFESGIILIKHWRIHNCIQKDRYQETQYTLEKSQVELTQNGEYVLTDCTANNSIKCIQNGNKMYTQVSIGKDSIGKDSIDKDSIGKDNNIMPEPIKSGSDKPYEERVNDFFNRVKDEPFYKDWLEAFPDVCNERELFKAKAWLLANKRKAKKDFKRFLYNWLSKAQDKFDRVRIAGRISGRPKERPGGISREEIIEFRNRIKEMARKKRMEQEGGEYVAG